MINTFKEMNRFIPLPQISNFDSTSCRSSHLSPNLQPNEADYQYFNYQNNNFLENMPSFHNIPSKTIGNNGFEPSNHCLQNKNANNSSISVNPQKQVLNPKFLNSMIKLIDKYHISFDVLIQNNEKNKIPRIKLNDPKIQEQKQKLEEEKNNLDEYQSQKKTSYKKFTEDEDNLLKNIVQTVGPKNWRLISSMIPNKTPRQCRDRYMNYLAPGFIHSGWTNEEDKLLAEKYIEYGPHWTKIQRFFPLRTANSIKNRYNYTISRNSLLFADIISKINNKKNQQVANDYNRFQKNANDNIIEYESYFPENFEFDENEYDLDFADFEN